MTCTAVALDHAHNAQVCSQCSRPLFSVYNPNRRLGAFILKCQYCGVFRPVTDQNVLRQTFRQIKNLANLDFPDVWRRDFMRPVIVEHVVCSTTGLRRDARRWVWICIRRTVCGFVQSNWVSSLALWQHHVNVLLQY